MLSCSQSTLNISKNLYKSIMRLKFVVLYIQAGTCEYFVSLFVYLQDKHLDVHRETQFSAALHFPCESATEFLMTAGGQDLTFTSTNDNLWPCVQG